MKKLILAIIAVCCVQLAYTAYNATEAGRQELARVISNPIAPPFARMPVADIEPTQDEAVDLDQDEDIVVAETSPTRRVAPRRKFRRNQVLTYVRDFETTSIVVPKGEKYEFKAPAAEETKVASFVEKKKPRTVVSAVEPRQKREKRTILDKTGSVIKKPFKWLKNIFAKND
ncbi:MAG: hypothetical protein KF756_05170 [Acidobacteria bacterium]|nr:hypothetical protein [Acidobacteriota bacterium]